MWNAEKIKALRLIYGETQIVFASRLGVTPTTLRYWEWGKSPPSGAAKKMLDRLDEDARDGKIRELVG